MTAISSSEFWPHLSRLLDLPKNVKSLTLRLGVDQAVEVDLTFAPSLHGHVSEPSIVAPGKAKRYHLVEIPT